MALKTGLLAALCLSLLFGDRIALAAPETATVESIGVSDLRRALQQLRGTQTIALDVQFKLFGRSGDDKDLQEREGLLQLRLEDSPEGLRMFYSPALIAQLSAEEMAKTVDEDVKNSALNAIGQFDYWEWRELMYPVAQLELMLARYRFLGESPSSYEGRPARLLRFSLPREKIDKRYRKYVKKYRNRLQLWIDEQGVPLASELTEAGSGRVFIVIGFRFQNAVQMEYQRIGDRLITRRREVNDESEGATMQSERHFISLVSVAGDAEPMASP
ncbi:hypothetical protein [Cellvibrio sp. PSBB023]|uniref:hypothetical protein n=1 Tax=Cellvibrio sp. PSBB023 TaxID=1945512 RepID=UPI00098F0BC0|nr:hypothetical protein [Cellvibrio sp. PSBB023]AQT60671.1 hypothetical protein B0D95_11730 [Cellvibrio sp. PSBB023]